MNEQRTLNPKSSGHYVNITDNIYQQAKAHAKEYSLPFGRVVDIALLMFLDKYDK